MGIEFWRVHRSTWGKDFGEWLTCGAESVGWVNLSPSGNRQRRYPDLKDCTVMQMVLAKPVSMVFIPLRGGGGCWWIFSFMKWKRGSIRIFLYNMHSLAFVFFLCWPLFFRVKITYFLRPPTAKSYIRRHMGPILKYSIRPKDSKNAINFFCPNSSK